MAEQEKKFKTGCLKGGMEKPVISKLWDEIVEFAQYGFNKAHSASYGRIAYQTAWLKANYPAEYMSALLSTNDGNADKVASFSEESKKWEYQFCHHI
jgi:DNA polymerase-3 subunit alpha